MTDWKATLNGVTLCGGDCTGDDTAVGCLLLPPDGLGVPEVRTEDLSYPQRDGVEHFSDWYGPRILTLTGLVGGSGCGCDGSNAVREQAAALTSAWSRQCEDVELVLRTGCDEPQLLPNPSFNEGIEDWTDGPNTNLDWKTDVYRTAPGSMQATLTLDNNGLSFKEDTLIRVDPLTDYQMAVFVSNPFGNPDRRFYIDGDLFDTDGVTVIGHPVSQVISTNGAAWVRINVTYSVGTLSGGYGWLRVGVTQEGSDPGLAGEAYLFDDFTLHRVPSFDERELAGPFGVRGRPRVGQLVWRKGKKALADFLGRFDGTDQRLYVLGPDGTPGSGAQCATITNAPGNFVYDSAVQSANGGVIDSHWPLDFTRIYSDPALPTGYQRAEDIIGSSDAQIRGGYQTAGIFPEQGPPISWNLSMSAIVGPAQLQTTPLPNPYSNAAFGWWQQVDGTDLPSGAGLSLGSSSIGKDAFGNPSPEIRWGGTNVAMNADVQDAFGFTSTLRNQPVLIVIEWNAGGLAIYAGHENSGATKLLQTVATGGFPTPAGSVPTLTILGRVSNVFVAINGSPNGETITDTLTPYAFDTPSSQVVLPNVGTLCSPIQVTFAAASNATFGDIYIFKEDGTYVGIEASGIGVDNPSSLDTDQGTARGLFNTTDFTPRITGNPFLQVEPGETLHVFGSASDSVITICFRPAVLSA